VRVEQVAVGEVLVDVSERIPPVVEDLAAERVASDPPVVAMPLGGERLVAVTWVQSVVRDPARRELLYGLNLAREKLLAAAPEAEETAQVNAAYLNLIRMWSDL